MKTYVVTLVMVCGLGAIVTCLAPGGRVKKYIQFLFSLLTLTALLSPLADLAVDGEGGLPWVPPSYEGELPEHGLLSATEEALKGVLCDTFSIPKEEILVEVVGEVTKEGEVRFECLKVTLLRDSSAKRERVRAYLIEHTTCEVEVHVGDTQK